MASETLTVENAPYNVVRIDPGTSNLKASSLLGIARPPKQTLALILSLLFISSLLALIQPWLAGKLTSAITERPEAWASEVQLILVAWLVLILFRAGVQILANDKIAAASEHIYAQLRVRSFEHAQALPLGWHQERKSGETMALLVNDTGILASFFTSTLLGIAPAALLLSGALFMMFTISPEIAIVAGLLLPAYYLMSKFAGRRLRSASREALAAWSDKLAFLQEHFALLPVIKAFGRESEGRERNKSIDRFLTDKTLQKAMLETRMAPIGTMMAAVGMLLLIWLALGSLEAGTLDEAALVSLVFYALLMNAPVATLASVYGQVQSARGAADRLQGLFAEQPEPLNDGGHPLSVGKGAIRFEKVTFRYPEGATVFSEMDLEIPGQQITAITGPNGVGKTTLAHLIMRFIEPQAGRVLIDDQPIDQADLASTRAAVGLVSQHALILNGTIEDNLRIGMPEANEEQMMNVCRLAGAAGFVRELPDGLATLVGEDGVRLSGGQRQSLSLARTLLKNPAIIILDEATSMLDPARHGEVVSELRHALDGKTVIIITHQNQNLDLADNLLNLREKTPP